MWVLPHIAILTRFFNLVEQSRVKGVLGDREFASGALFKWLNTNNIAFYIRIKEGSTVSIQRKKLGAAKALFKRLNPKQKSEFAMPIALYDQQVNLAGSRSELGELMIVATNRSPLNAIAIYLRIWEIECLFLSFKSNGFRIEDTHLDHERIEKLLA